MTIAIPNDNIIEDSNKMNIRRRTEWYNFRKLNDDEKTEFLLDTYRSPLWTFLINSLIDSAYTTYPLVEWTRRHPWEIQINADLFMSEWNEKTNREMVYTDLAAYLNSFSNIGIRGFKLLENIDLGVYRFFAGYQMSVVSYSLLMSPFSHTPNPHSKIPLEASTSVPITTALCPSTPDLAATTPYAQAPPELNPPEPSLLATIPSSPNLLGRTPPSMIPLETSPTAPIPTALSPPAPALPATTPNVQAPPEQNPPEPSSPASILPSPILLTPTPQSTIPLEISPLAPITTALCPPTPASVATTQFAHAPPELNPPEPSSLATTPSSPNLLASIPLSTIQLETSPSAPIPTALSPPTPDLPATTPLAQAPPEPNPSEASSLAQTPLSTTQLNASPCVPISAALNTIVTTSSVQCLSEQNIQETSLHTRPLTCTGMLRLLQLRRSHPAVHRTLRLSHAPVPASPTTILSAQAPSELNSPAPSSHAPTPPSTCIGMLRLLGRSDSAIHRMLHRRRPSAPASPAQPGPSQTISQSADPIPPSSNPSRKRKLEIAERTIPFQVTSVAMANNEVVPFEALSIPSSFDFGDGSEEPRPFVPEPPVSANILFVRQAPLGLDLDYVIGLSKHYYVPEPVPLHKNRKVALNRCLDYLRK